MKKVNPLFALVLFLCISCSKNDNTISPDQLSSGSTGSSTPGTSQSDTSTHSGSPQPNSTSSVFNETGFESNQSLNNWGKEIPFARSLTLSDSVARQGKYSGRFELNRTDPMVNGGVRAEINGHSPKENNYYYKCSIYFPSSYTADDVSEVITQWHEIPDFDLGETWRVPPVSLNTAKGRYHISIVSDPARVNADTLGHAHYAINKSFDLGPVTTNVWTDWVWHIKWGYDNSGLVEVWQNGKLVFSYNGPVGFNDENYPYFKIGIYKWAWNPGSTKSKLSQRVMYVDDVKIFKNK